MNIEYANVAVTYVTGLKMTVAFDAIPPAVSNHSIIETIIYIIIATYMIYNKNIIDINCSTIVV